MTSYFRQVTPLSSTGWQMPIVPESYDRCALTAEEWQALEYLVCSSSTHTNSKECRTARRVIARIDLPITDLFRLRHGSANMERISDVFFVMRREIHHRRKLFWDWSPADWMATLCPTGALFQAKHEQPGGCAHTTLIDAAYLLGGMTDLRPIGIRLLAAEAANTYFGQELVAHQCERVYSTLVSLGYGEGKGTLTKFRQCLSLLFILSRSPYLEDITQELLADVAAESPHLRQASRKITIGLQQLKLLDPPPKQLLVPSRDFDSRGMAQQWYAWCISWFDQEVNLTPHIRREYMFRLLAIGRWLHQHAPDVQAPEHWSEDLALRFRSDLCSWTNGQYGSERGRILLNRRDELGKPLGAQALARYLIVLRRFLTDLMRHPHTISGEPARKTRLDFMPTDVLSIPDHIKRALDVVDPRDIDLRIWARLAIAAATLSPTDLPQNAYYPLSFYRALALVWVTSARRPNEIARLRVDCLRQDWAPFMLDEDDQPVEHLPMLSSGNRPGKASPAQHNAKIYYLHIPSSKMRGPFWIWLPDYVAHAIDEWKRERPRKQRELLDRKDRQEVEYLFCYKDARVGNNFINRALIPLLCTKAGVDVEDARGRITGHRGRSTRLTLLRKNGVSLDDLAEYAGHADGKTIRRYARQDNFQLHRIIKDADEVSRLLEGVVEIQAAAQGLPALRWFIGYDTDAEPMYCANQVYHTCPHRLDCPKCGMFIGGEKARLLHEGENTLPITSKVPMTPLEKCVMHGGQLEAEACRLALQQVPTPQIPDLQLIFNPEGLSNKDLDHLASLATTEALDKLRMALAAHEKRLAEAQQLKTGRSALVSAQKKRISLLQQLISACQQRMGFQRKEQAQELS